MNDRRSSLDYASFLVPAATGILSWVVVLWYSDEVEAFDAQAPYWTVSLTAALLTGAVVGAPRTHSSETGNDSDRPLLSIAPLRPLEVGMAFAVGQLLTALVLAEEYTFFALGVVMLLFSGVFFSAAAAAGIIVRELLRRRRDGRD